jgi:hypothetical protein
MKNIKKKVLDPVALAPRKLNVGTPLSWSLLGTSFKYLPRMVRENI